VLYLGRHAPRLMGSLRREATLGIGRDVEDEEIVAALDRADLTGMATRLGGLDGRVAEGRRNLTATEQARLHLVRALLSRPALALIDADEIGLNHVALAALVDHLSGTGAAALIVTSDPATVLRLGPAVSLRPDPRARPAVA
jgi:ABC-type transport system involved in cytochrome bd biosynthesis fused ATPase/permease subunit